MEAWTLMSRGARENAHAVEQHRLLLEANRHLWDTLPEKYTDLV